MRMQYTLLLVVIVFSAGAGAINALEQAAGSKIAAPAHLMSSSVDVDTAIRLRRSHEAKALDNTGNEDIPAVEERGADAAWVSKLAQLDRETWKIRNLDLKLGNRIWPKVGWGPENVFNWMSMRTSGWKNIETNKKTIQFFRFLKVFRAKNGAYSFPDYKIYELLRTKVPEEKVALVLESLKQIPDLKNLAETVQRYQLKLWGDRGQTRTSIAKLLGITTRPVVLTERGPMDEILTQFTNMLLLGEKKKLTRSTAMRYRYGEMK